MKRSLVFLLLAVGGCGDSSPAAPEVRTVTNAVTIDTIFVTVTRTDSLTVTTTDTVTVTFPAAVTDTVTVMVTDTLELRTPPKTAPPGIVLTATVWASRYVITDATPSALDSIVYVGRGVRSGFWDPFERSWNDTLNMFLFNAHFSTDAVLEVQAHPAYVTPDSALEAAHLFLPVIGPLPRVLINGADQVELSPTDDLRASATNCNGRAYQWAGDYRTDSQWETPYLEEVALHEGGHIVLGDCTWSGCVVDCIGLGNPTSAEWKAAQAADGMFITEYARDHPDREDMAETLWAWFVSRCVPDLLHPEYKRRIDEGTPNRLAYFDQLGLDMRPWDC